MKMKFDSSPINNGDSQTTKPFKSEAENTMQRTNGKKFGNRKWEKNRTPTPQTGNNNNGGNRRSFQKQDKSHFVKKFNRIPKSQFQGNAGDNGNRKVVPQGKNKRSGFNGKQNRPKPNGESTSRPKLSPAYNDAVYILRMMSLKKGSINSLISTLRDQKNIKQVYALAIKVIKNQHIIKRIVDHFISKHNDADTATLDTLLIEVLLGDLLYGQAFFTKYRRNKDINFVLQHQQEIKDYYENELKHQSVNGSGGDNGNEASEQASSQVQTVRYVRVNLLKTTCDELVKKFIETDKFVLKKYTKTEINFECFKQLALKLEPNEFMIDYHFDDVLVFHDSAIKSLTELSLYAEDNLVQVQDKSSLIAIEAMHLRPGMRIFDACAAPGMKTTAIAHRLRNDCHLIVNDLNATRYKQMRQFLHKYGVTAKRLSNLDFSTLDPAEQPEDYANLDVILLDPSCSGSGMNRRFDYVGANDATKQAEAEAAHEKRVAKLAKFQLTLLQNAVRFGAKQIVYCTCSTLQAENEDVIQQLLDMENINYEVIDPLPQWPIRGVGEATFAHKCLRADLQHTLTGGFFCCVLQRKDESNSDEPDEVEKTQNTDPSPTKTKQQKINKKKLNKKAKMIDESDDLQESCNIEDESSNQNQRQHIVDDIVEEQDQVDQVQLSAKKSKKKSNKRNFVQVFDEEEIEEEGNKQVSNVGSPIKKKKKQKH